MIVDFINGCDIGLLLGAGFLIGALIAHIDFELNIKNHGRE